MTMTIEDNIASVMGRIATACERANRNLDEVTLVAVSKKKPVRDILQALDAGLTHFGENRVEESSEKIPQVTQQSSQRPTWHFIGHIQSRKAKNVVPYFDVVESIDRMKIARKLSQLAGEHDKTLSVLVEINISGESAKYGFEAFNWRKDPAIKDALWQSMRDILALPHLNVCGLMTMAPFYDNMEATRPVFAGLADLRDALQQDFEIELPDLSMGMTNDFPVAIEEGATIVRIGRAIFGERNT